MKLQLYYDPALHYFQEIEPRMKRCRETDQRNQYLEEKMKLFENRNGVLKLQLKAANDALQKLQAKPVVIRDPKMLRENENLERENEALRNIAENYHQQLAAAHRGIRFYQDQYYKRLRGLGWQ